MIDRNNDSPAGWCPQQDYVPDGKRYYRCSVCNRRLWPRLVPRPDGETGGACRPTNPKAIR